MSRGSRGTLIHTTEFGIIEPLADDDPDNIPEDEEESLSLTPPPSSQPMEQKIQIIDTDHDQVYVYNANHSSGASKMNDYDRANSKLEYDYARQEEIPKWEIIFRKSMYIAQIIMVCGAGIISCGAIVAEREGWKFADGTGLIYGTMEEELVYTPYICGIMSVITSVIGCIGAKQREKCGKVMLIIYIGALGLSLSLGIASVAQGFADRLNVYKYAQRQWDQLTIVQERIFEWEHFCCNFKALDPCCRFTYGESECVNEFVCYDKVKDHLISNFEVIIISSCIHTVYLFILMLAAITLLLILHIKYKWSLMKEDESHNHNQSENENQNTAIEGVPDYDY